MKQTIIYFTDEQHEALRKKAFNDRSSITELVRIAVDNYLDQIPTKQKKTDEITKKSDKNTIKTVPGQIKSDEISTDDIAERLRKRGEELHDNS